MFKDLSVIFFLFIVSLLFLLPGISGLMIPLQGDEFMHIATIRQSVSAGEYLLPVLQNSLNFYKPPLLFWQAIATELLTLDMRSQLGLLGVRLPALLATYLTAVFLYLLLRRFLNRSISGLAAFAYISSLGVLQFGRLLMMEQGMALSLLAMVYFYILFMEKYRAGQNSQEQPAMVKDHSLTQQVRQQDSQKNLLKKSWIYALFAGLISGVSFLYKGPVFQVYSGLILLSFLVPDVLRFSNGRWKGQFGFRMHFSGGLLFTGGLIVPVSIWFYTLFSHPQGMALFEYFYLFENVAKFVGSNQSELHIIMGWAVFALPWTAYAFGLALPLNSRRKVLKTQRTRLASIFWIVLIVITLFHFIPLRKSDYYVVPFLPFLFAAAALNYNALAYRMKVLHYITATLLAVLAIVMIAAGVYFETALMTLSGSVVLLLLAVLILILQRKHSMLLMRKFPQVAVITGTVFYAAFFLQLYPSLAKPVITEQQAKMLSSEVCVISAEPWDGFRIASMLPDANISHTVPGSPVTCADGNADVLIIHDHLFHQMKRAGHSLILSEEYELQHSYKIFGRHNDVQSDLTGRERFYNSVELYTVSDQTHISTR